MRVLAGDRISRDGYVNKIYHNIVLMALFIHIVYAGVFFFLSFRGLSLYNLASAAFYFMLLILVRKSRYRTAVLMVHTEVSLFVTVSVLTTGWDCGFEMYLVALASLVYFCPFKRRYIPYLCSLAEIIIFFVLKSYTYIHASWYDRLPESAEMAFYLYNCCIGFAVILYAAYLSNVSAVVSNKELLDANENLSILANHDQLTGLISRRYMLEHFSELGPERFVVAMGDIDDFKKVNDTYGHSCGDFILRGTAELMRQLLDEDVDICRWGGEEFVFLFYNYDLDVAAGKLQRFCNRIAGHEFLFNGKKLHITMTFGICPGSSSSSLNQLLDRADELMYRGKRNGKDCIVKP